MQTDQNAATPAREWLEDANGNKASIYYFGSEEAAQKALDSLKDCDNCINCSDCSDCSGCSYCSGCSDCSGCSGCSYCSGCSDCSGCSRCSDCSDCSRCSGCSDCSYCSRCSDCSDCSGCSYCSGCSDCSGCSRCSRCSDCSGCSGCSGCSDCSYCSDCSRCSGCSRCSDCSGKKNDKGDFTPPAIPKIDNIHAVIFDAASQPNALDMSTWHTCGTTHCRAGWVVHKAGEAGYALERFHGTALAAQLIYRESDPENPVSPVRFYETDGQAMADMKKLAELEASR